MKRQLSRDYQDRNSWQRQRSFDGRHGLDWLERLAERVVAADGGPAVDAVAAVADDDDAERVAAFVGVVVADGQQRQCAFVGAVVVDGQLRLGAFVGDGVVDGLRLRHVDAAGWAVTLC